MQNAGSKDHRKNWPNRNGKSAQANRRNGESAEEAGRAYRIHQHTAGHLTSERNQPSRGENETNIELRPCMGGEIDRHERAKARLDIRKKKREPVETASACGRR
jgi:hypothetical protein